MLFPKTVKEKERCFRKCTSAQNEKVYNWTTELLENSVQHEQYADKQFNDLKKADLIEKCNYSNGN